MADSHSDALIEGSHETADLVISPHLLLPVEPHNEVLEGMSLVLRDGAIAGLGERDEVLAEHPSARHLVLDRHVLMPGLVNAHGHLAMTLLRGLGESESLDDWLNKTIWPLEARWMDEDFVRDGTRLAVAEMVATGTTTASDMYYFPETAALACRDAGFRLQASFPLIEIPNAYSADFDECLSKGLALHDRFRDDNLITTCFGPHSAYTVEPERLRRVAMFADEIDADVHIHLHETANEGGGRAALPGRHVDSGAGRDRSTYGTASSGAHDHRQQSRDRPHRGRRGVRVVHCPHSNMKLASGICPVTRFLDAGATVGLGTDGAASNNALDLFAEARLAALLSKTANADPTVLPAADLVALATIGGARTLGMDDRIGSIEVGKRADLVAVDLNHPAMQPINDLHAALVHADAGARVTHTFIDGRCVYEEGVWPTLDVGEVLAKAASWRSKLNAH